MNLMMLVFIDRKLWPNLALHSLQFPYPKATILKQEGINFECSVRTLQGVAKWHQKTMAVNISEKSSVFTSAKSKYRIMQEEKGDSIFL